MESLLAQGKMEELLGLARANKSALARLVTVAMQNAERPREQIIEALELAGRREAQRMQRFVGVIGTIAAISPLLGLLGTVWGMIKTFAVIKIHGVGNAEALAGGISEALTTTAAGLTIAIPCLVFYRYFLHETKKLVVEMEEISLALVDRVTERPDLEAALLSSKQRVL